MAHTTAEASQSDAQVGTSKVLRVDDQPEVRRVVRRNLARAGYIVVEAWNGRVAIDLVRQASFDLVISDVRMPDMSGLELLSILQEHDPDLPVVLASGSLDPQSTREARELGAFAFLDKPFAFETMCEVASRAIAHRHARIASREQFEPFASLERLRVARTEDDDG